jgi:hypothetical protein
MVVDQNLRRPAWWSIKKRSGFRQKAAIQKMRNEKFAALCRDAAMSEAAGLGLIVDDSAARAERLHGVNQPRVQVKD